MIVDAQGYFSTVGTDLLELHERKREDYRICDQPICSASECRDQSCCLEVCAEGLSGRYEGCQCGPEGMS
jgi:hypothetical protein